MKTNRLHRKKVNRKYLEISESLSKNTYDKFKVYRGLLDRLKIASYTIDIMKNNYQILMNQKIDPEEIVHALPIESLVDYYEAVKFGKPKKFQFEDITKASNIKKAGLQKMSEHEELAKQTRLANIDYIEAEIRCLMRQIPE